MDANFQPRILIVTNDPQSSSNCAGMIRAELDCLIDECLGEEFLSEILDFSPVYDGIIFLESKDLLNIFKIKYPHYPCQKRIELILNIDAPLSIKPFLLGLNESFASKNFLQITPKFVLNFKQLPFEIYCFDNEKKIKILVPANQDLNPEQIKKTRDLFIVRGEYKKLQRISFNHPETLIFQCLQQSDNSLELLKNYEVFAIKSFSNLNQIILKKNRTFFLYALKICENSSKILSKIENQFDLDPFFITHSYLTAMNSLRILSLAGEISTIQFVLICFTAIAHDLELVNNKKYINEFSMISDLEAGNLDTDYELTKQLLYHGESAADLISTIGTFPRWVNDTLRKHHEKRKGTGFPNGEDTQGYSLEALVFIISHTLVDSFYQSKARMLPISEQIKKLNLNNYKSSALRNHLQAIEKLDIIS